MSTTKEKQLKDLKDLYVHFFKFLRDNKLIYNADNADTVSNPYFCGIPENWSTCKLKIMILGKEGYGKNYANCHITCDIIDFLQKVNIGICYAWCNKIKNHKTEAYYDENLTQVIVNREEDNDNKSSFKKAFGQLSEKLNTIPNITFSIIWNNSDKICRCKSDEKIEKEDAALKKSTRKDLHKYITSDGKTILEKEIEILAPTHLIFFGMPRDLKALNVVSEEERTKISLESNYYHLTSNLNGKNVKMLFTYHPAARKSIKEEGRIGKIMEFLLEKTKTNGDI